VTRRTSSLLAAALLLVVLLALALVLPVPYVALLPGPTTDTLGASDGKSGPALIAIDGRRTYPTGGKLLLTTVNEQPQLTLVTAVQQWLSGSAAVVPREVEQPSGVSDKDLQAMYDQQMRESQNDAEAAALHYLHIPVTVVIDNVQQGPSTGRLRAGDAILALAGRPVADLAELFEIRKGIKPGSTVPVRYKRGSASPASIDITTGTTTDQPPTALLGLELGEKKPFSLTIGLKGVGGPSAGLMFTLGIIDKLTPGPLTAGQTVAGTGTIDAAGVVGPIGGIQQKLRGARRDGATLFLVPKDNCAEASRDVPAGLRLARVDTLATAMSVLATVSSGRGVPAGC
jgi:PDZ domain-containing protein